jgi:hypothetical protein
MRTDKNFINGKGQEVSIVPLEKGVGIQSLHKTWKTIFTELASSPNNDFLNDKEDLPPQKRMNLKE